MKILVLLKQVPRLRSDTPLGDVWIDLTKAKFDPNSYDMFGLEAALQLVEARVADGDDGEHEVVVVSAGPERVTETIKAALEVGAHRAIHLCGSEYDELDAAALARVLSRVCERERPDLVIAGFMSDDGNAAAVGPMLAEYAGMGSATGIVAIESTSEGFRVERELEAGEFEVVDLIGPSVVTVQTGINEVRYPSLKAIVAARKKTIEVLATGDTGVAEVLGSVTASIRAIKSAGGEGRAEFLEGGTDEFVAALVAKLEELRVL